MHTSQFSSIRKTLNACKRACPAKTGLDLDAQNPCKQTGYGETQCQGVRQEAPWDSLVRQPDLVGWPQVGEINPASKYKVDVS